jgi:thiol-disulfide isomerase/thioredoxin
MKMRRILFTFILLVLGFFLYAGTCKLMGYAIFSNRKLNYLTPVFSGHEGELLPNVDILMLDSITHINLTDIPSGKPIVLFYFGPYCPYCQLQIEDIIKNIDYLKDMRIYLITAYAHTEMKEFYYRNKLEKYDNIVVGVDYDFKFSKYFNTMVIPCIAVYNIDSRLNSVYLGVVKYDQIVETSKE